MSHTTNYTQTLLTPSPDSPVQIGEMPPRNAAKSTIANMQYDMIHAHPYRYTSDDVIFHCYAVKQGIEESKLQQAREQFFSRGQACLRSSPLVKRYGWGIHHDSEGKVALHSPESAEYVKLMADSSVKKIAGMRSSRK